MILYLSHADKNECTASTDMCATWYGVNTVCVNRQGNDTASPRYSCRCSDGYSQDHTGMCVGKCGCQALIHCKGKSNKKQLSAVQTYYIIELCYMAAATVSLKVLYIYIYIYIYIYKPGPPRFARSTILVVSTSQLTK